MSDKKYDERFDDMFQSKTPPYYLKKKRTPKKDLEGAVVRECLMFLAACEQVVYFERRNTGAVQFEDGGFIRFGSKGAGDIWCLIRTPVDNEDGLFGYIAGRPMFSTILTHVEIEAKRRDGKGRLSLDQKTFKQLCEKIGVPYLIVTSSEDLAEQLQKAGLLA